MTPPLRLAIAGAAGRMGRALIQAAAGRGMAVVGATERPGSVALGKDITSLVGLEPCGLNIGPDPAAAAAQAQAWIDFTTPASTLAALKALPPGVAAIIGSTGFTDGEDAEFAALSKDRVIVKAGNFSLGVALLCALVRRAAQTLGPEWDIEIVEAHHRRKVDAPSGTALMLAEAAAEGRGVSLATALLPPRVGQTGPRPEGGVGMAVVRGGGIVGAHEAIFAAEREVLTLSHTALDRAVFADGALTAAQWAVGKPAGLYSISDVLGL